MRREGAHNWPQPAPFLPACQPDPRTRFLGYCGLFAFGMVIGLLIVFVVFELAHNWQTGVRGNSSTNSY
jgi:hypothetical protein